eukprot:9495873-Lingulodinium_polyedra.AAC.1
MGSRRLRPCAERAARRPPAAAASAPATPRPTMFALPALAARAVGAGWPPVGEPWGAEAPSG